MGDKKERNRRTSTRIKAAIHAIGQMQFPNTKICINKGKRTAEMKCCKTENAQNHSKWILKFKTQNAHEKKKKMVNKMCTQSTNTQRIYGCWRSTHFNLRKCKLNARNAIDNMIPIKASVDTIKNASGEMVATRNLKTRFAIGTWPFFHLIGTHFKQSKSKWSFDGWNRATDFSTPSCTWLKTEMPIRSAPENDTGPFTMEKRTKKKREFKREQWYRVEKKQTLKHNWKTQLFRFIEAILRELHGQKINI